MSCSLSFLPWEFNWTLDTLHFTGSCPLHGTVTTFYGTRKTEDFKSGIFYDAKLYAASHTYTLLCTTISKVLSRYDSSDSFRFFCNLVNSGVSSYLLDLML